MRAEEETRLQEDVHRLDLLFNLPLFHRSDVSASLAPPDGHQAHYTHSQP